MRIGFFTDTYFPQVSGVATSIKTLKDELEKKGNEVFIFTTTDPHVTEVEEGVIRMPSVPFVSFKDRRIVVRGMWYAYRIAKELQLDLIHTHTEFGAGMLGKMVGKKLDVPVIHTYHTMYEDYLHYIANGKVLKPAHVKFYSRVFANHSTGVVCPSERVVEKLRSYGVDVPMKIIPTGIVTEQFSRPDITEEMRQTLRTSLGLEEGQLLVLSLSRLSYEKNIQAIIQGFPKIIHELPQARLVIVGDGPHRAALETMVQQLELQEFVRFVGEVPNNEVAIYYQAADYFVSASTSETQGLTYTEAMAAGTQMIVAGNKYLEGLLSDRSLGVTYETDEDFPKAFIDYIREAPAINQEVLANKMYEISAECFGEKMIEFYREMLLHYQELQVEEDTVDKLKMKLRFFKGTSH